MELFNFKKWFFDVSEGMDDYLILFVSQIKLGQKYYFFFQMHGSKRGSDQLFHSGNSCSKTLHQKENTSNCMKFDEGIIQFINGGCTIDLNLDNFCINLVYKSKQHIWPDGSILLNVQNNKNIDWIPLILCATVSGSISANGELRSFKNAHGYCDEVISTFLPWKIPFKQLYWGRLHGEFIDLSFSILRNSKTDLNISKLYLVLNGEYFVLNDLSIDILDLKKNQGMNLNYADKYIIHGRMNDLSISMEVNDHQEMIRNDFMDYGRKYGSIATGLLRWISRDPKGIKFCASANINVHLNQKEYLIKNILFVDEYVEFR